MQISTELAQQIVGRLSEVQQNPITLVDNSGHIVASTIEERLGALHEGALAAMRDLKDTYVSAEDSSLLPGTLEGITLPLSLHQECLGALGIAGDPSQLSPIAPLVRTTALSLIEVAKIEHSPAYQQDLLASWVNNLATEHFENYQQLNDQAHYLQLDLDQVCSLFIIRVHSENRQAQDIQFSQLESIISKIAQRYSGLLFSTPIDEGRFVFALRIDAKDNLDYLHAFCLDVNRVLKSNSVHYHIGVGRPGKGIVGLRYSCLDAANCARIAERLSKDKRVLFYYEQHIFRLLENMPDYSREMFIANQTEGEELDTMSQETLKTFFAMNCRVNETAAALYIHRNTLLSRLKRIREKVGLDPQNFHDTFALQTLLYLQELS